MTAQKVAPTKSDTVYKKIDQYAEDKKFFKFVHKLMFRNRETFLVAKKPKRTGITPIQKSFNKYSCRIIRKITIETLDPFGYSVENDKEHPEKRIERMGNFLHLKTKNWTIRNLLLFKKNDPLDSLIVKESERLIRSQRYVRSVLIKPVPIENCTDSIDISVRVLDTWSLVPTGAFSSTKANLDLIQRNFFGLGHEIEVNYIKSFDNSTVNTFAYESKYSINNIKNTFVNLSVSSKTDLNNNTYKTIRLDRPFYSTYSRWAGGVYFDYRAYTEFLPDSVGVLAPQNYKIKTYQFWAGHSFDVFGKNTEFGKTTHLIFTAGFNNSAYLLKPDISYDPIQYSNSSKSVLATIGISGQKFHQDKYLFRFGIIEDVPYGKVFALTAGTENKNKVTRAYFGGRFSYGDYFDFGYLQGNFEAGSFFNNGKTEQTTYKIEANYFTNLFAVGSWKFRQFIKPVLVLGINRLNTAKDRLNLVDINGIPGFTTSPLTGTKKVLTTFQTQSYNQKTWYGFNFSPFFNCTLGFLDEGDYKFFSNKLYSQIGIGVLVNNNYLVFNSFQLSFSYYPSLPLDGSNIIKTNAFQNSNIEFKDFQIGQPGVVSYQ
ncbi:MAG: hypothetical protein WCJ62_04460 [Flavobacterium sp.]